MILRHDERGVLAIGQPAHAWVSGQLARVWGNSRFPGAEPREEVCLAAEQHDVGMALWDLSPTRNPETGLPDSFIEMPLETHLELWRAAPRQLLAQSRYASLLVSMHGSRLYARRNLDELRDYEAAAVRQYLDEQRRFQEQLVRSLRADPATLALGSQLIWTWDYVSLVLCHGWAPRTVREVPTFDGPVDLEVAGDGLHFRLEPWPFALEAVPVRCEGRRLTGRCETNEALREALAGADWEILEFELVGS